MTCSKLGLTSLTQLSTGVLIGEIFMAYCTGKFENIITGNHASYDGWIKFDHLLE